MNQIIINNLKWKSCGRYKCPTIFTNFKGLLAVDVSLDENNAHHKVCDIADLEIFNARFKFSFVIIYKPSHFTAIFKDKKGQFLEYNDVPKSLTKCRKSLSITPQLIIYEKL